MKILARLLLFTFFAIGQVAIASEYASQKWWDQFWEDSKGWGDPNPRAASLLSLLDGSKGAITVVDVGAGNGRNSVFALMKCFEKQSPKSHYVVHCIDTSETALQGLRKLPLPDWLEIVTQNRDINSLSYDSFPKADLLLLYGILEYVQEENLSRIVNQSSQALHSGGYLVIAVLVKGPEALEIAGEITRPADFYTECLEGIPKMDFLDVPEVHRRPDRHDLGKGYPEDHLHYVYRTVLVKCEP